MIVLLQPWAIPARFGIDARCLVDRRIDLRDGIGAAPVTTLLSGTPA
ncbi:hypothetical protein [Sorangium sp. So ce233]